MKNKEMKKTKEEDVASMLHIVTESKKLLERVMEESDLNASELLLSVIGSLVLSNINEKVSVEESLERVGEVIKNLSKIQEDEELQYRKKEAVDIEHIRIYRVK